MIHLRKEISNNNIPKQYRKRTKTNGTGTVLKNHTKTTQREDYPFCIRNTGGFLIASDTDLRTQRRCKNTVVPRGTVQDGKFD